MTLKSTHKLRAARELSTHPNRAAPRAHLARVHAPLPHGLVPRPREVDAAAARYQREVAKLRESAAARGADPFGLSHVAVTATLAALAKARRAARKALANASQGFAVDAPRAADLLRDAAAIDAALGPRFEGGVRLEVALAAGEGALAPVPAAHEERSCAPVDIVNALADEWAARDKRIRTALAAGSHDAGTWANAEQLLRATGEWLAERAGRLQATVLDFCEARRPRMRSRPSRPTTTW